MTDLGLTSIAHLAIRARDIDAMVAFYTEKLGFAEMFRLNQDNGALMLVYLRITDDQYLELFPNGTGDGPSGSSPCPGRTSRTTGRPASSAPRTSRADDATCTIGPSSRRASR